MAVRHQKSILENKSIRILTEISVNEVVLIFLKGEIVSPRFMEDYLGALKKDNRTLSIINSPNLDSESENAYRLDLLGKVRGFGTGKFLFENFPEDTRWFRAEITKDELLKAKYINWSYWNELSGGSRLPIDAARSIKEGKAAFGQSNDKFLQLADAIKNGKELPELILVSAYKNGELVILEGHNRLTGLALVPELIPEKMQIIIGLSDKMGEWGDFSKYPFRKDLPA